MGHGEASAMAMFKLKVRSENDSQKPIVAIEEIGGFTVWISDRDRSE